MSPDEKAVARQRIDNARHALRAAVGALEKGEGKSVVNRCYYGCFYAVNALLYTDSKYSKKHSGVQAMTNSEYIKLGILSAEAGRTYNKLFDRRLQVDYEDFAKVPIEEAREWLQRAEAFVDEVAEIVYNRTPPPLADPEDLKE